MTGLRLTLRGGPLARTAGAAPTGPETARWLIAWAGERFPARNAAFFLVFYATGLLVARAAVAGGAPALGWRDAPGFLAVWAFFLLLRVLDEHKDFAADAVAHPGRVLQRGLITLGQLRVVGALAVALQLGVSLWLDGGVGEVTRWWLAVLAWSALMSREFFVRAWLRSRLMVYALTHMLVMPLLVAWVAAMGAASAPRTAPVRTFALLAFLAGLCFEMARKLRAPVDELPMADSYTRALGVRRAPLVLLAVLVAATAAALAVAHVAAGAVGGGAVAVALLGGAVGAAAVLAFRRRPTTAGAKRAEGAVGLAVLAGHLAVIGSIVAARGARIG